MKTRKISIHNLLMIASAVLVLTGFISCEKEPLTRIGFDTRFTENSSGLTMVDVFREAESLHLHGNVKVLSGEVVIELINDEGFLVYTENFTGPGEYTVYESFRAEQGYWKLRYRSNDGDGSIKLHLEIMEN